MNMLSHSLQKIACLIGSARKTSENQAVGSLGRAIQELVPAADNYENSLSFGQRPEAQSCDVTVNMPPALAVAKRLCRQGNLNLATEILLYLHDEASFNDDVRGQALAMNQLGVVKRMQRKYDDASSDLTCALIDFQRLQDWRLVAEGINNLGMLSFKRFEYERAADAFDDAQRLCNSLKYDSLLGFVFLNKAELFLAQRDCKMAAKMCAFGLTQHVRHDMSPGIARGCLLVGQILWKCQQIQIASAVCLESMRLYRTLNIPLGLANCCTEFSTLLNDAGEKHAARKYWRQAHSIYEQIGMDVN